MLLCGIPFSYLRRFHTVGEASHDALFVIVFAAVQLVHCANFLRVPHQDYVRERKNTATHFSTNELAMYVKCIAYLTQLYAYSLSTGDSDFQLPSVMNFLRRIRVPLNPSHLAAHHLPNIKFHSFKKSTSNSASTANMPVLYSYVSPPPPPPPPLIRGPKMRAVRVHRFGGPEVLQVEAGIPVPPIGETQV